MTGIKIDEINANILRRLLKDARTSFTELAKENNITVAATINRYKSLRKAGVIKCAIMQVNPSSLGLNCNGYLGLEVDPKKKEEIIKFLDEQTYIYSTWNRLNKINIGCFFAAPDLKYFNMITEKLKKQPHIKNINSQIHIGFLVSDHPENLIIKSGITVGQTRPNQKIVPINSENKTFLVTPEVEQMDQVDRAIAKMLSADARISFRFIAKKLKMSTSTALKRYRRLRDSNLFIRSTISVDLKKLGYNARAMIFFNITSKTNSSELQMSLLSIPNLIILNKMLGNTDMLAVFPIRTIQEFFKIKAIFYAIEGIEVIQIDINAITPQWPFNFFANFL